MKYINHVELTGRIPDPVELRYAGRSPVACFALQQRAHEAGDPRWDAAEPVRQLWIDVRAEGRLGEAAAAALQRGGCVRVAGRLRQDSWRTKDGRRMVRLRLVARRIESLDRPIVNEQLQAAQED